ncbi:MAG: hypothetical protein KTR16_12440 [Acidiferrobacterales bacterium]|nr:hypothetical protein [Acidiferrobacterales bacterium]
MNKLVFTLFLLCLNTGALAGVWHSGVKINTVYPLADGNFILRLDQDHQGCLATQSPDYYRVSVGENDVNEEGANKLFSLAMAASLSGKKVNIYFQEGTEGCYINRIMLISNS